MLDTAHKLVKSLIRSKVGGLDSSTIVIETHISIVMLTPEFAYKLKKPVNYGFVDFSTLELRKFYCEEEIRLNKRLAGDLYIEVIAVKGTTVEPKLDGNGKTIEYLVKMQRFDNNAELSSIAKQKVSITKQMGQFATELAEFHLTTPIAGSHCVFGKASGLLKNVNDNFCSFKSAQLSSTVFKRLSYIESWTHLETNRVLPILETRKKQGFVRECHGDLHLRNLVLLENKVIAFDCLEFNQELRWIDVANELAFLLMDLTRVEMYESVAQVLNCYLESTGDYNALKVLRYFMVYRSMVRAKIEILSLDKDGSDDRSSFVIEPYLSVAEELIDQASRPLAMVLTYGLSGSGKSWISKKLRINSSVIHIRSDVVRKLMPSHCTEISDDEKYSVNTRNKVYEELEKYAEEILNAGYSVIVDATFLDRRSRYRFQELAAKLSTKYHILELDFPVSTLEQRIMKRQMEGLDASEADVSVLYKQIEHRDVLMKDEQEFVVCVNEQSCLNKNGIIELAKRLNLA